MSEWIKCTDRLPDVGDNVIIFDGEEVVTATLAGLGVKFDGSAVFWGYEDGYAGKVRFYSEFWMPKPAPPTSCFKCGGTGQMDSGGTQPWGDAIMFSCDCQPTTDTYRQIENDDWIEWHGFGGCPVHEDVDCVEIKIRSGLKFEIIPGDRSWLHYGNEYDIIAYRVIENDGREG